MKHKITRILMIGTLIFAFLFISAPITTPSVNKNVKISSTYVPEGLIAMWSGSLDSIPDGWILCDGTQFTPNTTERFIVNTNGTEGPGSTGRYDNHSHSYTDVPLHDHGPTTINDCTHSHTYNHPSGIITDCNAYISGFSCPALIESFQSSGSASGTHSHTTSTNGASIGHTSEIDTIYPPYYKLAFIKKVTSEPIIPIGIILIWTGLEENIPEGWLLCNGTQSTPDLDGNFIMGETLSNPGLIGGNLTHSHTYTEIPSHSHTTSSNGASHSHSAYCKTTLLECNIVGTSVGNPTPDEYTNYNDLPHTHSMSGTGQALCTTETANHEPPYTTVGFIVNSQVSAGIPTGCICFWDDSVANIPYGWGQCDGTSDTMDLREQFLKASSLVEPIGTTGGSLTHTHIYTEVPYHTHTIQSANMRHRHQMYENNGNHGVTRFFGTVDVFGPTTISSSTGASDASHSHEVLAAGVESPETDPETNIPPYLELIYIQHISPITSLGWVSPDAEEAILFPRAPTVQFDFEYSWLGLGNDITLSFSNGTHIYEEGSVLGLDHIFMPYLDGDVEATFHLMQDATELTTATRSFYFYNNRAPTVDITSPNGGETISGDELIEWTGSDLDGDQIHYQIEYNREDTGWVLIAAGETGTSYLWDTTAITDSDSVKVRVIATDGFDGQAIDESDAIFTIDNTPDDDGNGDDKKDIPGYNTAILLSMVFIASALFAWKRKK